MRSPNDRGRRDGHRLGATVLVLSLAAAFVAVSAQTTELRLVSTAWSPFTNEPGQPRFALDLVEAGLGRIGVKTSTTIVDAAQFTSSLLSGKFDGSAAAWKDAERERTLLYDGWTTVPDRFKVEDPKRPDPNRSTAVIFRFAW